MIAPRIFASILQARQALAEAGVDLSTPPTLELHQEDYAAVLASIPMVVACPAEDILVYGCRIMPAAHCQPGDVYYRDESRPAPALPTPEFGPSRAIALAELTHD